MAMSRLQIASNNSSINGQAAKDHETFDAYPSWNVPIWDYLGVHKVLDFEKHWTDNADAGWSVIDLPTAADVPHRARARYPTSTVSVVPLEFHQYR